MANDHMPDWPLRSFPAAATATATAAATTFRRSSPAHVSWANNISVERRLDNTTTNEAMAEPADPLMEKRIVRKLDRTIVPMLWILMVVSFADRSNIGESFHLARYLPD